MYNKRTWLNPENSPSLGSVVAYDDREPWKDKMFGDVFLAISDCHVTVKLHKTEDDSIEDFINKMKLLHKEIGLFIEHLEKKY